VRRWWMLAVLMAVAGAGAIFAVADADADAKAKIIAMEHVWGQSYVNKDPKALERILDDAFVNVDSDGNVQTKAEVLAEVKTSTLVQYLTESMEVHLHGDTAVVTGIFVIKGVDHGTSFSQRERFVDTWSAKNGQWVSIAGLVTRVEP
jgi:ketosteroid isomerase-like protein